MHKLKRSALHALVWAKPMTQIGKELGISDVGLAKACRRHGIPVPPRGHWAKLAAGKQSPVTPLPEPDKDFEIGLTTVDPQQRERHRAEQAARDADVAVRAAQLADKAVTKPAVRQRVHPLIRASRSFVARIPAMEKAYARSRQSGPRWGVSTTVPYPPFVHKGRRVLDIPDVLPFTVSDPSIQWAIDWHERLFSVLQPEGVTFSTGIPQGEKHRQVLIERAKEQLYLSMSEGYKKQDKAPEEVDAKPSAFETSWDWAASGRIKIQAQGTEFYHRQSWSGHQEDLDSQLHEIAAALLALLDRQPHLRAERLLAKERAEEEARRQRRERERQEAIKAQFEAAIEANRLYETEQRLQAFLDDLERRAQNFREPGRERLLVWIRVVRQKMAQDPPHLNALAKAIAGNRWNDDAPAWWPDDATWQTAAQE